mmetsp:Transcript_7874/g.25059  ORF Transcript_7874/g.25059 Transcript_7874/m.25059 type:complete len:209 (+) Transcript_7874:568-1194(+)
MTRSGKALRSEQSSLTPRPSIVDATAWKMGLGTAKREVPVSTIAPQPPEQATLTSRRSTLKAMALSDTPQVMLPATGIRFTPLVPARVLSFQMRKPGEFGSLPRQVENVLTPKASSMDFLPLAAASAFSAASFDSRTAWGTSMPLCLYFFTRSSMYLTSCSAVNSGWPGGPMPAIALKLARASSGIWQSTASQRGCSSAVTVPMDAVS